MGGSGWNHSKGRVRREVPLPLAPAAPQCRPRGVRHRPPPLREPPPPGPAPRAAARATRRRARTANGWAGRDRPLRREPTLVALRPSRRPADTEDAALFPRLSTPHVMVPRPANPPAGDRRPGRRRSPDLARVAGVAE